MKEQGYINIPAWKCPLCGELNPAPTNKQLVDGLFDGSCLGCGVKVTLDYSQPNEIAASQEIRV